MTVITPEWRIAEGEQIAHAVRSGHTLCGKPEPIGPKALPNTRRCTECEFVPLGHAMHMDMTDPDIGVTYRQLDYWTRSGWLHADVADPGQGHRRTWCPEEQTIARRMRLYVQHAKVRPSIASKAARNDGWIAPGVRIVLTLDGATT